LLGGSERFGLDDCVLWRRVHGHHHVASGLPGGGRVEPKPGWHRAVAQGPQINNMGFAGPMIR
jgi:hypothetical protein